MGNLEEAIELFHKSLSLNRDCVVTSTILKTCIQDLMDDDSLLENLCLKNNHLDTKYVESKSPIKRSNPIERPLKISCLRLKFDEYEKSLNSDSSIDNSCDMSVDI